MLKNNKGSTLIMLLLMLAILSILGIALLNVSINDNRYAIKEHDFQQTYYIARAGAAATADYMFHNYLSVSQLNSYLAKSSNDETNKDSTDFAGGSFKVSMFKTLNKDDQLLIESIGSYKGLNRKVSIALIERNLFSSAIIALNEIYIGNPNCKIYGDIATTGDPSTKITFGATSVNLENMLTDDRDPSNEITYGAHQISGNFPDVDVPNATPALAEDIALLPSVGINYSDTRFRDKYIGDFNLGSDTLQIDNEGNDMYLVFDNLKSNGGVINVYGGATLELYVDDMKDFKGDINIYGGSQVVILANGSGEINYKTGSSSSSLYVYAPEATVNLDANYLIIGSIIANNVNIGSGADVDFDETTGDFPSNVSIDMHSYEILEWLE